MGSCGRPWCPQSVRCWGAEARAWGSGHSAPRCGPYSLRLALPKKQMVLECLWMLPSRRQEPCAASWAHRQQQECVESLLSGPCLVAPGGASQRGTRDIVSSRSPDLFANSRHTAAEGPPATQESSLALLVGFQLPLCSRRGPSSRIIQTQAAGHGL